jgi:hypothetical protein
MLAHLFLYLRRYLRRYFAPLSAPLFAPSAKNRIKIFFHVHLFQQQF